MERKICGRWGYGPPEKENFFEVRLLPQGQLLYSEGEAQVD